MPLTRYATLAAPVVASVEDRRSVFECWLRRADDEAAARAVVQEARQTHWDARHHCSAFLLGPAGEVARSSDDGEPSGTAGLPMLEVLRHGGLSDVVAVVTRWFGGTLLGTGGLVRAYSEAVRAALDGAVPLERELRRVARLDVDHAEAGRLEHELRSEGVVVADVRYAARVTLELAVPANREEEFTQLVARGTGGQGEVAWGSARWVDLDAGSGT
ncbi:IMPACT family protein [Ornithinicoccus hortensis]|uniref:Putative YigZ family protein n=1 Tax=Ornithinicoccus hortensis TaxID=82346 RepID=A0A542YNK9_9MICO|nr:YigZ family protein [Ornithinicoccus hortensis]TQL49693.1 putative YigZ family protein [Ornithinicoccus hortensis]